MESRDTGPDAPPVEGCGYTFGDGISSSNQRRVEVMDVPARHGTCGVPQQRGNRRLSITKVSRHRRVRMTQAVRGKGA